MFNSSSEFGRLDISHLGMWLNLDKMPGTANAPLNDLLASAVRHEFSDLHREAVANARSAQDRSALIGLLTSVAHEARHFHDLLISPYGARLMHFNVRAAMAVLGAQGSLARSPAIIVPLSDWRTQLDTLRLVDPDLAEPYPKLNELADTLTDIRRRERALERGILNPNAPFTATSILESSALLVQLGAAGRVFGFDAVNELSAWIGQSPGSDRYNGALRFIKQQLGHIPIGCQTVLLLAALSGDVFSENEAALRSPVDVLVALTSWLSSMDSFPIEKPPTTGDTDGLISDIFDLSSEFLFRSCGRNIKVSMSAALDITSMHVADYERRLEGQGDDSIEWLRIRQLLQVYKNFRDVSTPLMANFCSDPSWYLVDQYLDRLPHLPQPLTFFWSNYGIAATPDLQRQFYIQHEAIIPIPEGVNPDLRGNSAANSYFDGEAFRLALVLASLDSQQLVAPDGLFKYPLHRVDHEAWLGYFNSIVPLTRLLTNGADARLPGIVLDQAVTVLEFFGTKVYSGAGRIHMLSSSTTRDSLLRWDTRYQAGSRPGVPSHPG